ncbi:hypothetical protein [Rothia mucilaginosa]|jgi:hypothetical protein|uniref:hypothetical protein n=1 Tax=Rothia mucilaginosa TaxID=43675 RepID=UPI0028DC8E8A|nr:hypothetical protein [Rothia mucilaginosa]
MLVTKSFDFSNQKATIDKLQELGVLDRLKAMAAILEVSADRNTFASYDTNQTKGSSHYDLVRSVMSRVTHTGKFQIDEGVEPIAVLDALIAGLPPESREYLPLDSTYDCYTMGTFDRVPYWEVDGFCSLILQSANRFEKGVQGIRWERPTKRTIVSKTQHHIGNEDDLFSINDIDLGNFTLSLPMHLPALVVAYNISPDGELLEFVLGVPTPANNKSDTPWLWTYNILDYPVHNARVVRAGAPSLPTPREQVPDVELRLKRETSS